MIIPSFHLLLKFFFLLTDSFYLGYISISIHNNTHSQIIVFSLRFSAYSWDIYCRRSQIDISFQLVQSFVSRTLSNVKIFSLLFVYFCKIHVIRTFWPTFIYKCNNMRTHVQIKKQNKTKSQHISLALSVNSVRKRYKDP